MSSEGGALLEAAVLSVLSAVFSGSFNHFKLLAALTEAAFASAETLGTSGRRTVVRKELAFLIRSRIFNTSAS